MVDTDGAGGAAAVKIAEFDGAGVPDVQIYVDDTASYTV